MQCPLQPLPELVMEPNHTRLLLTPLLSPLIIWLAEMLTLLSFIFLAVFQDPAQLAHTINMSLLLVGLSRQGMATMIKS